MFQIIMFNSNQVFEVMKANAYEHWFLTSVVVDLDE